MQTVSLRNHYVIRRPIKIYFPRHVTCHTTPFKTELFIDEMTSELSFWVAVQLFECNHHLVGINIYFPHGIYIIYIPISICMICGITKLFSSVFKNLSIYCPVTTPKGFAYITFLEIGQNICILIITCNSWTSTLKNWKIPKYLLSPLQCTAQTLEMLLNSQNELFFG